MSFSQGTVSHSDGWQRASKDFVGWDPSSIFSGQPCNNFKGPPLNRRENWDDFPDEEMNEFDTSLQDHIESQHDENDDSLDVGDDIQDRVEVGFSSENGDYDKMNAGDVSHNDDLVEEGYEGGAAYQGYINNALDHIENDDAEEGATINYENRNNESLQTNHFNEDQAGDLDEDENHGSNVQDSADEEITVNNDNTNNDFPNAEHDCCDRLEDVGENESYDVNRGDYIEEGIPNNCENHDDDLLDTGHDNDGSEDDGNQDDSASNENDDNDSLDAEHAVDNRARDVNGSDRVDNYDAIVEEDTIEEGITNRHENCDNDSLNEDDDISQPAGGLGDVNEGEIFDDNEDDSIGEGNAGRDDDSLDGEDNWNQNNIINRLSNPHHNMSDMDLAARTVQRYVRGHLGRKLAARSELQFHRNLRSRRQSKRSAKIHHVKVDDNAEEEFHVATHKATRRIQPSPMKSKGKTTGIEKDLAEIEYMLEMAASSPQDSDEEDWKFPAEIEVDDDEPRPIDTNAVIKGKSQRLPHSDKIVKASARIPTINDLMEVSKNDNMTKPNSINESAPSVSKKNDKHSESKMKVSERPAPEIESRRQEFNAKMVPDVRNEPNIQPQSQPPAPSVNNVKQRRVDPRILIRYFVKSLTYDMTNCIS
jgi:hypothetical protein